MRALILRLRDHGCTVFFSWHILGDAEAVCGRVGILACGRLPPAGCLSEMLASETPTTWMPLAARGWIPADPPTDPAGVRYVLDSATGRATVSGRSPYHPLPTDLATARSHPWSPTS